MNTNNRNLHQEIHELIENRTWAFGHVLYQTFYLRLALIAGIILFFVCIWLVALNLITEHILDDIVRLVNQEEPNTITEKTKDKIRDVIIPFSWIIVMLLFTISISLLIIARYAKKILNRNNYIMQLENLIKSTRTYGTMH